jgi:glycosyltransferase involved in cell wall biosynthesis
MTRRITPLADLRCLRLLVARMRSWRPDVVHAHTPKGGLLGMLAAALAGVPVRVFHLRGLLGETAEGLPRLVALTADRVSCSLAQRLLCVSPSVRAGAVALGLAPQEKLQLIGDGSGNGVDALGRFDPARYDGAALRRQLGIAAGAPVLGFVGRLAREKGVMELAEAWRRLRGAYPDLQLLLVGPHHEERSPLPPGWVEELARQPGVHAVGVVAETAPWYAAMDVLALPSWREGMPNAVLEASAMGLPVVASACTGCRDAVVDGQTGTLVPVRDAGALAAALGRYLADGPLRREHGAAGRRWMLAGFAPERIWRGIHAVYRELLAEAP